MDWKLALVVGVGGLEFLPKVEEFKGKLEVSVDEQGEKFLISERGGILNVLESSS